MSAQNWIWTNTTENGFSCAGKQGESKDTPDYHFCWRFPTVKAVQEWKCIEWHQYVGDVPIIWRDSRMSSCIHTVESIATGWSLHFIGLFPEWTIPIRSKPNQDIIFKNLASHWSLTFIKVFFPNAKKTGCLVVLMKRLFQMLWFFGWCMEMWLLEWTEYIKITIDVCCLRKCKDPVCLAGPRFRPLGNAVGCLEDRARQYESNSPKFCNLLQLHPSKWTCNQRNIPQKD